jgi:hypothetical protein
MRSFYNSFALVMNSFGDFGNNLLYIL